MDDNNLNKRSFGDLFKGNAAIFIVAGLVFLLIFIAKFGSISDYFFSGEKSPKGELFKVILTVVGGVFVFYGLILNARRTRSLEKQTEAANKQNKLTEKGKIDERFKNAIEHLGNENAAITLGGIHSLHRIAQEDATYREPVFNILCSYIREITTKGDYINDHISKPSIVIQTILDTLFKYNTGETHIYMNLRADLNEAVLNGVNLERAILIGANLRNAKLNKSYLLGANLQYSILFEAQLCGAKLNFTFMEGADLTRTKMISAFLFGTYLQGAELNETQMQASCLFLTNLQGAIIKNCNFDGAYSFTGIFTGDCDISQIKQGKLDIKVANSTIECYKKHITDDELVSAFAESMMEATERDTNVEENASCEYLTTEELETILSSIMVEQQE